MGSYIRVKVKLLYRKYLQETMTLKRLCFLSHIIVLREVGGQQLCSSWSPQNLSVLHPFTLWFLVPWSKPSQQHVDISVLAYELKRGEMSSLVWGDHLEFILPLLSPWATLGPRDASRCFMPNISSATVYEKGGEWIFVDL